jgi:hypothetical protein
MENVVPSQGDHACPPMISIRHFAKAARVGLEGPEPYAGSLGRYMHGSAEGVLRAARPAAEQGPAGRLHGLSMTVIAKSKSRRNRSRSCILPVRRSVPATVRRPCCAWIRLRDRTAAIVAACRAGTSGHKKRALLWALETCLRRSAVTRNVPAPPLTMRR